MANSLAHHLRRLEAFLKNLPDAPEWSRVLIVERLGIAPGASTKVARSSLHDASNFAERFDEFARRGYSWINLSGSGVLNGALIVSVVTPTRSSGIPFEHVSVNLSGPMQFVRDSGRWDLSPHMEIV
jgi:hypothetical protein